MTRLRNPSMLVCDEDTLAITTLQKVGYGFRSVTPWYSHGLQQYPFFKLLHLMVLLSLTFRRFFMGVAGAISEKYALQFGLARRAAAIKKKEQKAKELEIKKDM